MKRLFIILLVLFTFLLPNSASARDAWVWAATSLIGGATGSLDGHAYTELQDKDICITGVQGGKTYHHVFNSASAAAESSPDVILPDDVGVSNGRWLLIDSYSEKLDGIEVGSTKYPDVGEQAFLDADHTKLNGITALADVTADNAPKVHAASHTNGTDDIQSATNAQKGVATAAHITAIEANTDKVTESTTITCPDANVTAGIPITFADTGIMAITESGDTITFDATEVDGSTTNEINTIQGDDDGATTGLAISVDGAGIVTTDVVGDVLTVTGTEVDGSVTNELNIFTTDDAEATAGTAIVIAGGGINATTEAADTITITATEADTVIKAIGTAQGDIIYWTGANTPARLAKGTATHVLTMNAGATAPEWAAGGGGYTNLTSFVDQTAWRVFYSNTDGDVTELALGADGTFLKSNGPAVAPTFTTPSGVGDVVGPATNTDAYIPQWDGADSKALKNGFNIATGVADNDKLTTKGYVDDNVGGAHFATAATLGTL